MFMQKLARFMYGRYGMDQLNIALTVIYFLLIIVNMFVGSPIIAVIGLLLFLWELFRFFSRKTFARQRENRVFMKFWGPVSSWISVRKKRFAERKYYRYRTCPSCKATLRLPVRKGKHTTKCPKCGNEFAVHI